MKQELEECKCPMCLGTGTVDDADYCDISYNEWECPKCKGLGINPKTSISLDIERTE